MDICTAVRIFPRYTQNPSPADDSDKQICKEVTVLPINRQQRYYKKTNYKIIRQESAGNPCVFLYMGTSYRTGAVLPAGPPET